MTSNPIQDKNKIIYSGFFEKLGGNVHNWKKRFFVIYENNLLYFKDKDMKDHLGSIPLIDINLSNELPSDGPGFYFMLKCPASSGANRTEYLFRTSTEEDRLTWCDYLSNSA